MNWARFNRRESCLELPVSSVPSFAVLQTILSTPMAHNRNNIQSLKLLSDRRPEPPQVASQFRLCLKKKGGHVEEFFEDV